MHCYRVQTESGPVEAVNQGGVLVAQPWLAPAPAQDEKGGHVLGQVSEAELLAPLTPRMVVAIGLNYWDHIEEAGLDAPKQPLVFAKLPSSVTGPRSPIVIDPSLSGRVDWEVELGVIIGEECKDVAENEALEVVFGYTVGNDVSARDVQFADGQWVRGKSFDTFCPLGPCVVTRDEIDDPQDLMMRTRVNGETMQEASTSLMIFSVRQLVAFCSRCFTLVPGDLILTGTPWGCGEFMDPQRALRQGDVVEAEIDGIGMLRNAVEVAQ